MYNLQLILVQSINTSYHNNYKPKDAYWLICVIRTMRICFDRSILKFKSPPYLFNKLQQFRTDNHNLNIRRKHLLVILYHRKETFKRSFSYIIAKLVNRQTVTYFRGKQQISRQRSIFSSIIHFSIISSNFLM